MIPVSKNVNKTIKTKATTAHNDLGLSWLK